jgi:hypothetical protein
MEKIKASFANVGAYLNKITSYEATLRVLSSGSAEKPKLLRKF